ncbi:hypothetical protein L227DRAFT_575239 [Lentinus tigrinus ALCF2SS1-6]|uniref:BTB domain-containing protein n=2 Tax=Lentinus tigrinus TaxID=5365 RepID=A0A5C2SA95_9APHY|nr:hypothetical protein L227DRAFT_575239 [Lentinus tigrinus ALCF2SS1-6]
MSSPGHISVHRARTDTRFLIEASPQTQPRILRDRDNEQMSRSYPGTSSMSTPIMGSPPSPILQPERPPRALSPELWNLSSPNPSEMPSPLRNTLVPMLNLAREAKEELFTDRSTRDNRSAPPAPAPADDHRASSKARSTPASPPSSRASGSQSHRKYRSPRVETDSEGEDNARSWHGAPTYVRPSEDTIPSHSWRTPTVERLEAEEPRTPPTGPITVTANRMSPRRSSTKNKAKRSSIAQRRLMESAALSSDSGIIMSPMCHSPLVSLPLPDIPQSATDAEQFFPPERPPRSHQRERSSPSPLQSPLTLQPGPSSRPESPRDERREPYRSDSPDRSGGSLRGRESPNAMSVPIPLSPGSTLAQTRPPSPAEDPRGSPKAAAKAGSSKQYDRSPSPPEEPAVRHSTFYLEDEMVILRVENTLFRVHRYFLERDSTFFKDFFQKMLGHGAGRTDDTAVRLKDVSRREFECLLAFLYNGPSSAQSASILNLVLLLSTASALSFPAARAHAISALDAASPPLDPVERVFLAEKYAIPAWLRPAYVALCSRAHALEDAEAEVLGLQTMARLARAREAVLEEKVKEWRKAVERAESGEGFNKEDMQVREAKLVERVVDEIFGVDL